VRPALRRFGRVIGIVAVFAMVGPLALAALVSLIVVALGTPLLQLLLSVVDLDPLRGIIAIALWLLAFVAVVATLLPATAAGLIFALAAVYRGDSAIWMAWIATALVVAAVVTLGLVVQPSETSPVMLPSVHSLQQALSLSGLLAALAIGPASLCWWLAKPLHRASLAA